MIAITVEEGEDWKDVQIPSGKQADPSAAKADSAAPQKEAAAPVTGAPEIHIETIPGVGPASNLRMAQYGIDPRYFSTTVTLHSVGFKYSFQVICYHDIMYFYDFSAK